MEQKHKKFLIETRNKIFRDIKLFKDALERHERQLKVMDEILESLDIKLNKNGGKK